MSLLPPPTIFHPNPSFWTEALSTAAYLINRLPSSSTEFHSPYYRLFQNHPSYDNLHVFCSVCFVHLPSIEHNKLPSQSAKCAFIGYAAHQKGFLCYDPQVRRIHVSRNVFFFDKQYFFQHNLEPPDSASTMSFPGFSNDDTFVKFKPNFVYHGRCNETTTRDPPPESPTTSSPPRSLVLRRSTRVTKTLDRYGFSHNSLMATLSTTSIPQSYSQAVHHECWKRDMQDELDAL